MVRQLINAATFQNQEKIMKHFSENVYEYFTAFVNLKLSIPC